MNWGSMLPSGLGAYSGVQNPKQPAVTQSAAPRRIGMGQRLAQMAGAGAVAYDNPGNPALQSIYGGWRNNAKPQLPMSAGAAPMDTPELASNEMSNKPMRLGQLGMGNGFFRRY